MAWLFRHVALSKTKARLEKWDKFTTTNLTS